jgi:chromate transporter
LVFPVNGTDMPTKPENPPVGLRQFTRYFLRLGLIGFGGPVALVGFMNRDLVERRGWIKEDVYQLGLALAQIMPGPLAAQLAIALGYFQHGILGATLTGFAFVLPSFLMVIALSVLYVAYGGLWWMQALFYGIGASVVAVIVIAAYKLARSTNKRDLLQWSIFGVLMAVTVFAEAELAWLFILAGLLGIVIRAWPRGLRMHCWLLVESNLAAPLLQVATVDSGATATGLLALFLFFVKSSAFVFGSGLSIVPFLYKGVVQQFGWLNERQFLDAVAVAMITPGPVVITVAFIGYLVAGIPGATVAAIGVFLPVYVLTIIPAPWFKRNRENAQLRAFVQGATAAATGALSGAVVVLAKRAIVDLPTAAIALVSLVVLWRFKLPEPVIVLLSGGIGLVILLLTGRK